MNIISYDKYLGTYRFYTGVNMVLPNLSGYPGSVHFVAVSRYNAFGEYMSDVRRYVYMPSSLFQVKEWTGDIKYKIEEMENILHDNNYGWCHDDI